jgi:penicillin amidase
LRRFRWLWLVVGALWITFLARPWGKLPALGPLFDVRSGIWAHQQFQWQNTQIPGLKEKVRVAIDAQEDLYVAQGYIMAAHRLFQMDLSSRATSGHLAELVGEPGLAIDRFYTRLGMRQAVMQTTNAYEADPVGQLMMNSFVQGVNAYIRHMPSLPVEYKLLRKQPELFDASRIAQMAKALTFSLSGRNHSALLSHLQQQLGTEKVLDLFPEFLPNSLSDYILPGAWQKTERLPETADLFAFKTHLQHFPDMVQPARGNGSNNWAVGPSKSKTGHSILANDTHLSFSLPNIWFENQLSCPEFNVYGVSLINVPGVIGGFNPHTAWGVTNGTTAAFDLYEVEFTDETSYKYKDGEHILAAEVLRETLKGADSSEEIDVPWTKWGPVIYREGRYGLVGNWTGHLSGMEMRSVLKFAISKDIQGCLEALKDWRVPVQNLLCADQDHIAISHAGFVPVRAVGEGRFIEAAGHSENYLRRALPEAPALLRKDPAQGYLRSANERVVDQTYPYYLGWEYEEPFRGMRIKQLLEGQEKFSGQDFIAMQNDDLDTEAQVILPDLLQQIDSKELSSEQREALEQLKKWDLHAKSAWVEPTLYRSWYYELRSEIFSDKYSLPEQKDFYPHDARIAWMLQRLSHDAKDSDAQWIGNLSQVVTQAYKKSWLKLTQDLGPDAKGWTWKRFIHTQIPHVAHIPGFGSELLGMDGAPESVRGNRGGHGAVYKLVVELGETPQAWIQVPGGNQGDPFATNYAAQVEEWSRGEMRKVDFYRGWEDAQKRATQVVEFSPGEAQ